MRYATGELIPIWWEDRPESKYIRGHVDAEQAIRQAAYERGYEEGDFLAEVAHVYIRFVPTPIGGEGDDR